MYNNINFFEKIKQNFINKINDLFKKDNVNNNDDHINNLKEILIEADIEINIVEKILKNIKNKNISTLLQLKMEIFNILKNMLLENQNNDNFLYKNNPHTILIVGINGVGKTTTTVKLANFFKKNEKKVIIAAGDTYRAAGIEQLDFLCKKHEIPIVKQHINADSASVIFDALNIAKNKNIDILIADTSGRLHNNEILMKDLKKITSCLKKIDKNAPNEILMVIDSNFGQNSINQFKTFNNFLKINGLILTKFDYIAKAGFIFSIINNNIPIRYICDGENINDIQEFNIEIFLKKLLDIN